MYKAGFQYDSTYSYPDSPGFRNGMCHPFYPFNLETETSIKILEIPLIFMDVSINLDLMSQWKLVLFLLKVIKKNRGVFTINFHNNTLSKYNPINYMKLYNNILKYGKDNNAWITNCNNVYGNYHKNFQTSIKL